MFLAVKIHTSGVHVSIHLQGRFKPPKHMIRGRNIGLHGEHRHTAFAREQESFAGYNSRVRCQAEHLRKSVRLLANDCSQSRASAVRAALDDLFASVEELSESALAEQLDCSARRATA